MFIAITYCGLKTFIPKPLSNDNPPPIKEHNSFAQIKGQKYTTELVLIDPAFTEIEVNVIENALQQIERSTMGIIKIYTEIGYFPREKIELNNPNAQFIVMRIKPANETEHIIELIDMIGGNPIVGYADMMNITEQDIKTVYIVNGRIDSIGEYRTIVMHEFFHTIGLGHLRDYSLMAPGENWAASCITLTDLRYFCYIYDCDAEQLNPCDIAPSCSDNTFHLFY